MVAAVAAQAADEASIRPFTFRASDEDLADLKRRIAATRWRGPGHVAPSTTSAPRRSSIGYRSPRDHELSFNAGALSA